MTTTELTIDPSARKVPPYGGFNRTILGIELKRMLATVARSSSPWSSRP